MSTGRNEPCPCGSGRKYKKCCMRKAAQHRKQEIEDMPAPAKKAPSSGPFGIGISPHAIARMIDGRDSIKDRLTKDSYDRMGDLWTPGKVQKLTEAEIVAKLKEIAPDIELGRFASLAQGFDSGWDLAGTLKPARKLARDDDDFFCLGICELWKRWLPDNPCVEAIDDWMQDGYGETDHEAKLGLWMRVWDRLKERITPYIRTLNDTERVFVGSQFVSNWIQDYEEFLSFLVIDDSSRAEIGIGLCEDFLRMFPDEKGCTRLNFLCALGGFRYSAGEMAAGDEAFDMAAAENPNSAGPVVRQCYALQENAGLTGDSAVMGRMKAKLVKVRSLPDAEDYGVDRLINELDANRP